MQIDNKFLQKICDTMRDDDYFCISVNSLYAGLYDTYDTKTADKLTGHLYILKDEGLIEVLCGNSLSFDLRSESALIRLTSKGYGLCSCIK
ncbi:MAG: hypothetical protein LUH05_02200 [Candidatus Gastranaerophilales bacterium]|nr:hypothetical protein [Candidatus Gastranaerophilales bacterium]